MTIPAVRIFDANALEWSRHEQFPEIRITVLEARATHPAASIMLVQVGVGGVIETHQHAIETETAVVLAGRAQLTYRDEQALLTSGKGVTIPPGTPHSLRNVGDVTLEMIAIHTPPAR
jgi:mannose-6-phosphate isomerase-like protein (cupin superfamily)